MATYYTLVCREKGSSRWSIQFGDYERPVVVEEQRELRRDWPRGTQWKIVKSEDTQRAVEDAIKQLGTANTSKVFVRIWVRSEPARGGRTARLLCVDPEDLSVKKRLFKHYNIPMTFIDEPLIVTAGRPNVGFSRHVVGAAGLNERDEQKLWDLGATLRRRMSYEWLRQLVELA